MLPRIMIREDPEISDMVMQQFEKEGVNVLVNHKAKQFLVENGEKILICEHDGKEVRVPFDELLCAVGRVANTAGYGLEELGIPVTETRTVEVNEFMQTIYPNIYACGDVAGPYQFTHTAAHTAWYAAVNALFGSLQEIPRRLFRDSVGDVHRPGSRARRAQRNRSEGKKHPLRGDDLRHRRPRPRDRRRECARRGQGADGAGQGQDPRRHHRRRTRRRSDHRIHSAMRHGIGLNKILGTIHIYPTLAEANKYAAGAWKRAHTPKQLLKWIEKFHAWMRG